MRGCSKSWMLITDGAAASQCISHRVWGCATYSRWQTQGRRGRELLGQRRGASGWHHVAVTSIIDNPNADPHDYEATAKDARAIADAQYVVVNGAGYDAWAQQLIDANPSASRKELDIAKLVGKKEGDNEHLWYSPEYVMKVVDQLTTDFKASIPQTPPAYDQQNATFKSRDAQGV